MTDAPSLELIAWIAIAFAILAALAYLGMSWLLDKADQNQDESYPGLARIDREVTCLTCERLLAMRNSMNRAWVCMGCKASGTNYEDDKRIWERGRGL